MSRKLLKRKVNYPSRKSDKKYYLMVHEMELTTGICIYIWPVFSQLYEAVILRSALKK